MVTPISPPRPLSPAPSDQELSPTKAITAWSNATPQGPRRSDPSKDPDSNNALRAKSRSDANAAKGEGVTSGGVKRARGIPKLDDFELIRVLGKGCAGRVLLVRHTPTSAVRAMKAISKRAVFTYSELDHTLAELSILKRFARTEPDNPFVAKLHSAFTDRENFYLVMDFYPGGDLATQMEICGILGHHRTRFYAADMVQGLEDLHRHGIIVRDLKPENVLLNATGHAVLADFGLSREFPYRGDPRPVHIVTYPGEADPPPWAGQGAGSRRVMADGKKRNVVDWAYSFVGTSEYLSPEVVRQGEYSYAVDWWALGCIVLEGLIGRVPFRKEDDDPAIILWNKILLDPWDLIFSEPAFAQRTISDYVDTTTWHFIDSLLQKDPMWRLTEPNVKTHEFFTGIDWSAVKRGEYYDPHGLQLHPTAEYNTQYFPKLCLEEVPSVDVVGQEERPFGDETLTPLNDNALYALEQAKYRKELEGFAWNAEEETYVEERERSVEEEAMEAEMRAREQSGETEDVETGSEMLDEEEQGTVGTSVCEEEDELDAGEDLLGSSKLERVAETPELEDGEDVDDQLAVKDAERREGTSGKSLDTIPTLPASESTSPVFSHNDLDRVTSKRSTLTSAASPTSVKSDRPLSVILQPSTEHSVSPVSLSAKTDLSRPVPIAKPPRPPVRRDVHLPCDLPGSGLSVSDIVSIPSPVYGSPSRLIRRHRQLPSVDSIPIPRLSVEINGAITHLGDEDWEELETSEHLESVPNGMPTTSTPSAFFSRVLRRRPSTLATSGLRRQARSSDSSRDSSPTKPGARARDGSQFTVRGIENTKKALERIKFPKLKRVNEQVQREETSNPSVPEPPTPSRVGGGNVGRTPERPGGGVLGVIGSGGRPGNTRRHTEKSGGTGWFDRRPRSRKHTSVFGNGDSEAATGGKNVTRRNKSAGEQPTDLARDRTESASIGRGSVSVEGSEPSLTGDKGGPPKLQLRKTEAVVWDMDWGR